MQRSGGRVSLAKGTATAKFRGREQAWHVCRPERPLGWSRMTGVQSSSCGQGFNRGQIMLGLES